MRPRPPLFLGTRGGHEHVTILSAMDAPDPTGHATCGVWRATPAWLYDHVIAARPANQAGIRSPYGDTALAGDTDVGVLAMALIRFFYLWDDHDPATPAVPGDPG